MPLIIEQLAFKSARARKPVVVWQSPFTAELLCDVGVATLSAHQALSTDALTMHIRRDLESPNATAPGAWRDTPCWARVYNI